MLDKLPAWLRHLVIVFGSVFGGAVMAAIIKAGGVTTVDWLNVGLTALDLAAVSTATAAAALWFTPLTKQYGVGAVETPTVTEEEQAEIDAAADAEDAEQIQDH